MHDGTGKYADGERTEQLLGTLRMLALFGGADDQGAVNVQPLGLLRESGHGADTKNDARGEHVILKCQMFHRAGSALPESSRVSRSRRRYF